jgi:nitrite reductase [NAD(P)H] large subunit
VTGGQGDRERLLVVGNGVAAMRTVATLLSQAPHRYDITVVGAEPHPSYNRVLLSAVLAGDKSVDEIVAYPHSWYAEHGVTLLCGRPVVAIDRAAKIVSVGSAGVARYDRLLLATGSTPLLPPIASLDLPGVGAFRDVADVERLTAAAARYRRAVVIGGGLLGLEAAWGLQRRGMKVAVVHLLPSLMERQLDAVAGGLLERDLATRGIAFFTGCEARAIVGRDRVEGVRLADGRQVAADLVVLAIGIRPNTTLAAAAGVAVNRGILVDDHLRTSDPSVCAVGECIEHSGRLFGLVAPIAEQAAVCAAQLAGDANARYVPSAEFASLKVSGIRVFSAGRLAAADAADEEIVLADRRRGIYKKLVLNHGRIVGSVLYGDVADGSWYFGLMRDGTDVSELRDRVIFGRAYAEAA